MIENTLEEVSNRLKLLELAATRRSIQRNPQDLIHEDPRVFNTLKWLGIVAVVIQALILLLVMSVFGHLSDASMRIEQINTRIHQYGNVER